MIRSVSPGAFLVLCSVGPALQGAQALSAQNPALLVSGQVVEGRIGSEGSTAYGFKAASAGVLTIVVRAQDEADLFLLVTDRDGQPLPDGRSDQDLGGDSGAEQFAVAISRSGEYLIRVENYGGAGAAFKIGVSWLPFQDLAVPPDPDGSPTSAVRIQVGQSARSDAIDSSSGDYWDWFVLKIEKAGTLTLATRAEEGDLVLEAFRPGEFIEAAERSDQDLQGSGGNEALTLLVEAGDELFFRVSAFSAKAAIPYRLQIGFIPN